jgi:hypothetical protein
VKIWCMCIDIWIPKATNTHWKYVILVAFPLQQWLDEHTSVLCYPTLPIFFFFLKLCSLLC